MIFSVALCLTGCNRVIKPMTSYLTIRSDDAYSGYTETQLLVEYLTSRHELIPCDFMSYESKPGLPWLRVVLADCGSTGNYAIDGRYSTRINVVELICSDLGDPNWYQAVGDRIAKFLRWQLIPGKVDFD